MRKKQENTVKMHLCMRVQREGTGVSRHKSTPVARLHLDALLIICIVGILVLYPKVYSPFIAPRSIWCFRFHRSCLQQRLGWNSPPPSLRQSYTNVLYCNVVPAESEVYYGMRDVCSFLLSCPSLTRATSDLSSISSPLLFAYPFLVKNKRIRLYDYDPQDLRLQVHAYIYYMYEYGLRPS